MLEQSLSILRGRGLDPLTSTNFSRKIAIVLILIDIILLISLVVRIFDTSDLTSIIECFNGVSVVLQIICKEVSLLLWRQQYLETISCLKRFWPLEMFGKAAKGKISNIHTMTRKFVKSFIYFMYFACTIYVLKPIIERRRILVNAWVTICRIDDSLCCYGCNYILQIVWIFRLIQSLVGFDTLFIFFVSYGYCEFEQLKYALVNMKVDEQIGRKNSCSLKYIGVLVKQHNLVLGFIKKIGHLYSGIMLFQFSAVLLGLCSSFFVIAGAGPPQLSILSRLGPYVACCFAQLFIYCLSGQIIREQSESVAHAAYASKWSYSRQPKLGMAICLVIQRAQRPAEIKLGGFLRLDMEQFVAITKAAASGFTLMQTMYSPE